MRQAGIVEAANDFSSEMTYNEKYRKEQEAFKDDRKDTKTDREAKATFESEVKKESLDEIKRARFQEQERDGELSPEEEAEFEKLTGEEQKNLMSFDPAEFEGISEKPSEIKEPLPGENYNLFDQKEAGKYITFAPVAKEKTRTIPPRARTRMATTGRIRATGRLGYTESQAMDRARFVWLKKGTGNIGWLMKW